MRLGRTCVDMAVSALAFDVPAAVQGSQNVSERSHELVISTSNGQWAVSESCVNQGDDQGREMCILFSLAKLITDTSLEWFPRYIIFSVSRSSLVPSFVHVSGETGKLRHKDTLMHCIIKPSTKCPCALSESTCKYCCSMVELHFLLICSDIVEPHGLVSSCVRGNMYMWVPLLPFKKCYVKTCPMVKRDASGWEAEKHTWEILSNGRDMRSIWSFWLIAFC